MDLLALADFNLLARHGGFGKAARMSGLPKACVPRMEQSPACRVNLKQNTTKGETP